MERWIQGHIKEGNLFNYSTHLGNASRDSSERRKWKLSGGRLWGEKEQMKSSSCCWKKNGDHFYSFPSLFIINYYSHSGVICLLL